MTGNRDVWIVLVLAVVVGASACAPAEEAKFVCSRDVWVSSVPTGDEGEPERDTSMSKTPQLKIKTIQEMAILDFDLSKLKGKKVSGGWLYFHIVHNPEEIARVELPFKRKHLLRRIGLSTVSADWVEGKAAESYKVDREGFGATFKEASYSKRPWAWPGSDVTAVTFGNGNSLQWHTELADMEDLWARVKVPDYLIQSLIARDGFGWCIMDEIGYALANNFIHSREAKGFEPYLVVNCVGEDKQAPGKPKVTVRPALARAHMATGAVALDISGSADTFCYFVKVNGKDVPQWQVPHPEKGKSVVVLDDMAPGAAVAVEVVACDGAGNRAAAAKAKGKASSALAAVPKLPAGWKGHPGDPPVRSGKMRVWALPEISKVKPTNGALFEAAALGTDDKAYQRANSVWDGAGNFVRLFGAKGEIVAFQLCVERQDRRTPLEGISVALDGLAGPSRIGKDRIRFFKVWYVPMAEYAVPLPHGGKFAIPYKENALRHPQRNQQIYVDIAVPQRAAAGNYTGKIVISAEGVKPFELPVKLKVHDFAIPDKMRFNPELNIYQAPARPGSEAWFECFRVAHYNRCTLSITQAGHGDGIKFGPPVAGSGANVRVRDWTAWDKAYGPLLDGSAFKGLPRAGEPLATCQVPLSHGYPLPLDRYYQYAGPKKHKNVAMVHALMCKPIDRAFSRDYERGFQSFSRQIVRHFQAKGWTKPYYMFYLDAKVMWRVRGNGTSYWILDEPYNYDDWMALRYWGDLWLNAIKDLPKKTGWGYRCDISRPQWTRDWLDGTMTIMYVGGLTRRIKDVQKMAKRGNMIFYSYGACNRPNLSHWNSAVWCLQTFLAGGDGVLPWQSLGSVAGGQGQSGSLRAPDPHGLIVPNALGQGAIGSIRIMALRRGAQDCEYLLTLGERYGFNREQLRALVAQKIAPKATLKQLNEDDAAPVTFDALDPDKFTELREGLAKLIEKKK